MWLSLMRDVCPLCCTTITPLISSLRHIFFARSARSDAPLLFRPAPLTCARALCLVGLVFLLNPLKHVPVGMRCSSLSICTQLLHMGFRRCRNTFCILLWLHHRSSMHCRTSKAPSPQPRAAPPPQACAAAVHCRAAGFRARAGGAPSPPAPAAAPAALAKLAALACQQGSSANCSTWYTGSLARRLDETHERAIKSLRREHVWKPHIHGKGQLYFAAALAHASKG